MLYGTRERMLCRTACPYPARACERFNAQRARNPGRKRIERNRLTRTGDYADADRAEAATKKLNPRGESGPNRARGIRCSAEPSPKTSP